jgi:hypothetical protein
MKASTRPGPREIVPMLIGCVLLQALTAAAQTSAPAGLSRVVLPGGLAGARQVVDDRTEPDRGAFLPELIQRFYNSPVETYEKKPVPMGALLERLQRAAQSATTEPGASALDTVALPLSVDWWRDAVFHGSATPETLVFQILRTRDTALLYWGLLALDPPTRLWLGERRELVSRLLQGRTPSFVIAAPGIRIVNGALQVPGGPAARQAWEAEVGARAGDPDVFLSQLLSEDRVPLAYLFGALGQLPDPQLRAVLRLDAGGQASLDALRRLHRLFLESAGDVVIRARPFLRAPVDPGLLMAQLPLGADGRVLLPGNTQFWREVFAFRSVRTAPAIPPGSDAIDLVWLLEQVFDAGPVERRLRIEQVLFALHVFPHLAPDAFGDAAVAAGGLRTWPALIRTLERIGVADPAVYRHAVERASRLDEIGDATARRTAIAQYQGALAIVARAASRGSIQRDQLAPLVTALAGIETSKAGNYDGGIARWIDAGLCSRLRNTGDSKVPIGADAGRDTVEADLTDLLAGPRRSAPPEVQWEGTRYRVDLAAAEIVRLRRNRGDEPLPFLSAALGLLDMAARLEQTTGAGGSASRERDLLDGLVRDVRLEDQGGWNGRDLRPLVRALQDEVGRNAGRAAADARLLADELTARGLMELAYAVALGSPDAGPITASEAAQRHDFGRSRWNLGKAPSPWSIPERAAGGGWRFEGALLGLDIALADRWLRRVSTGAVTSAPSLDMKDRKALAEAVAIMAGERLTDPARDTIDAAMRNGRARISAADSLDAADALAAAVPLSPLRRSLLEWTFLYDRGRVDAFFAPAEVFRLGLGDAAPDRDLDAWGAPARPRSGCLCLEFPRHHPRELLAGRWGNGLLMSAVPDLNLRLAELLARLQMPAALLPGVLAAATLDVTTHAPVRYPDDVRALVERARAVTLDQVEQYLALRTTDGPLVPESGDAADGRGPR